MFGEQLLESTGKLEEGLAGKAAVTDITMPTATTGNIGGTLWGL